mgnify:CR=1 FL=1
MTNNVGNRKFIPLSIALIGAMHVIALNAEAQQEPQFSQSAQLLNSQFPSFNGWHGGLQVSGLTRQQFTGFEGRPETTHINTDAYVAKAHTGIGLHYFHDGLGQMAFQRLQLSISPRIVINKRFAFLPSIGYARNRFRLGRNNWRNLWTSSTPPFIFDANQLNIGLGFVVDRWYGAFNYKSGSVFSPQNQWTAGWGWNTTFSMNPAYSFMGGTSFSKLNWVFQPGLIVQTDLSSIQYKINLNARYKGLYIGLSTEFVNYYIVGIGYEFVNRYRLSYTYDLTTSRIRRGSNGSHEIGIRILLFDRPEHRLMAAPGIF